jgi:diaminohydroxyphosphoribosylaminopyrimidine deaminase/5-amino-6-(5-phosphoribosylamino)uracil reductase
MIQNDARFMAAALAFGRRGLGVTSPNPSVGALLVKDGRIVGRGCTAPGGRPHGEILALNDAGDEAKGATLYVTLEPCSHHGQTPPCCEAIVAAGVARVVYAIADPNPDVSGRGAAYCRDHGLEVLGDVGAEEARRDHIGHIRMMTRHRPAVALKLAETADGFVAGGPYDPRLSITGAPANGLVHVRRAMHDAIMVGIGTIRADDPLMTVRLPGVQARPTRVIIDALAKTPPMARVIQTASPEAPVLLCVGPDAPPERVARLQENHGVEHLTVPGAAGVLDLDALLEALGRRGLRRIFSEGGPTIAGALIAEDLVDEIMIFTAPRPLCGEGIVTLSDPARAALTDPARFRLVGSDLVGVDRLRTYESVT